MTTRGTIVMLVLTFAAMGVPGCQQQPGSQPNANAKTQGGPQASNASAAPASTPAPAPAATPSKTPQTTPTSAPAAQPTPAPGETASVVFAGGCFWCVEAVFEELEGVISAESGYSGGSKATADYKTVCTGATGHAEAVKITYDPAKISYEKLLSVHFATHDPTTLNRQGNDFGTQYRSAIFYASDQEKQAAQAMIDRLTEAGVFKKPIVTTLEPLKAFYPAEAYHQDFVCNNPYQGYVQAIAMPKVEKVRKLFKDDLKKKDGDGVQSSK